ncbi:sphingomyelin phosphodiesterase [Entamoeba marina]
MMPQSTYNKLKHPDLQIHSLITYTMNQQIIDVESKPIRILTYNLYLRPLFISAQGNDHKNTRLKVFCKSHLNNYDIICFQEVFNEFNSRRTTLINKAKKVGFHYVLKSKKPKYPLYVCDSGLLIISRYPITSSDFFLYHRSVHADAVAAKGILYAKISITPSQHIHLFNTHTQAVYTFNPHDDPVALTIRNRHITSFFSIFLLCGDFNVNGRHPDTGLSSEDYNEFLQNLNLKNGELTDLLMRDNNGIHPITFGDVFVDNEGIERPCDTEITYEVSAKDKSRLDYIFYWKKDKEEPRIECKNCHFPFMSDHYGVATEVYFLN